jgi:hypothetical protein
MVEWVRDWEGYGDIGSEDENGVVVVVMGHGCKWLICRFDCRFGRDEMVSLQFGID